MAVQKLNFSVDLNYLCSLVIQQEYERLSSIDNEEILYTSIYPLFDYYINKLKNNHDFIMDFEKYCKSLGFADEVTVKTELLHAFACWWFIEFKKTDEYKKEQQNRTGKLYLDSRIKEFKNCDSAIYCIEFDRIVEDISMGEHWKTIIELIEEKFGKNAYYYNDNYPKYDKWISENILITGCFNHPDSYSFKSKY